MNRRQFLSVAGAAAVASFSGCLADPGRDGGVLQVYPTRTPPNATVTDAPSVENQPMRQGLNEAHSTDSVVDVDVQAGEYDAVAEALSSLPWYSRSEYDSSYLSGVYLRYRESTYVAVLLPYCSESRLWDTSSERGEYSWGGCTTVDP